MNRRHFIQAISGLLLIPFQVMAAVWNKQAFDATQLDAAIDKLQMNKEELSSEIDITAPEKAENGAVVQIEINSRIPNTEAIAVFVENNPTPLIVNIMLEPAVKARLVTRIKMSDTSNVKVVAKVGNRYFTNSRKVIVLEDGCGGAETDAKFESSMKMRAKLQKDETELKVIIVHPMSTGRGKNDKGDIVPAHFIQVMNATLNGKPLLEAHLGTGIAKNPYFTFYLTNANQGDEIAVQWQDNQSYTGQGSTKVTGIG